MDQPKQSAQDWKVRFFAIWSGQAFSLLGSQLVQFALVWWLTKETRSATVLATATLVAIVPGIFLGPFAGALVDRWNRRLVMIAADGVIALATLGLALVYALGAMQPWHIYVIAVIRSLGGSFHWPAMQASTSLMVPKEHLSRVAGANQTLNGVMNIISPPLGALLIGLLPLHGVLAVDVGTALLAIVPLLFVAVPQPERRAAPAGGKGGQPSLWQDMAEGWHYAWGWTGLVLIGLMATMLNALLSPAFSLLPLLVTRHLGGQALQLGSLQSALGIGIVLGGLTLSAWGGFRRRILTSMMGVIGLGAGVLIVGVTPALASALTASAALGVALAGMFVAGFMNPIANGPLFATVQAVVAPEMQGRVFTLMGSVSQALSLLGLAVAGPLSDWLGIQTWFVAGGALCILMGAGACFVPAIVHLEDGRVAQDALVGARGNS